MQRSIDIFNIHEKIMNDYKHFVGSFINIKDRRIREVVEAEIDKDNQSENNGEDNEDDDETIAQYYKQELNI